MIIAAYVPYSFWHEAQPRVTSIIQSSLSDYQHELLLQNGCGIPVHQQHGSLDDNVPPSHSRRLSQLLVQIGCPSKYVELPGKRHYFQGVMTTQTLLSFYSRILEGKAAEQSTPTSFETVVANPASTGSKGEIVVDQLVSPGLLGRVKAEYTANARTWRLQTLNVQRLHLAPEAIKEWVRTKISIDNTSIQLRGDVPLSSQWLVHLNNGSWKVCHI